MKKLPFRIDQQELVAAGIKTQTRRLMNPQPDLSDFKQYQWPIEIVNIAPDEYKPQWEIFYDPDEGKTTAPDPELICKYRNGDIVRAPAASNRLRRNLEIIDVRAEMVQDISIEDIKAEGVVAKISNPTMGKRYESEMRMLFQILWDSIYRKPDLPHRFSDNPWTWVIEFKEIARGNKC